jgi:outer membrane lipoprotein-sorting protein
MGRKGDLLELIDGAPIGVRTLTGSVWKWTHPDRSQRALTELTRSHGGSVSIARFGSSVGETTDEHIRVWLSIPDRWRFESEEQVDLRNGATRWIGSSTHITEMTHHESTLEETEIGLLVAPGDQLLGALRFGEPTDDVVAGRPCLKVSASITWDHAARRFNPQFVRLGAIDHTFWFDEATGIALRHVGLVDDEPCTIIEFTEIRINPPLTDLDFEFVPPPDAVVTRQVEVFLQMAEARGVDLSGVDREDLQAVQEAFHRSMRPDQPTPESRLEMQKAKHVPVGDPPDDEVAARESIEYAFNNLGETDADGDSLVNVQSARGLVGPLQEAQKRVPGAGDNPATASLIVDSIRFLRSDEAVVWFSVEVNGERFPMVNGREGRAVKVGDRWMIEHATIADLLGFAGVVVPPPEE